MKKIFFVSLMSVLFLLVSAENSFACSCVFNDKPLKQQVRDAFNGSTAIFLGEVISITLKGEFEFTVKLRVEKYWKGKLSKEITITTTKDSAMCGYQFETGKKYLVYANGSRQELMTGLCTRTALAAGNGDNKYLDKLKKPVKVK